MDGGRAGQVVRWTRATVLAVVVMGTGTLAHSSAGGALPGGFELAALTSFCVLACAALLGAQRAGATVVAMTVAGQVVVHTALGAISGHGSAVMVHTGHTAPGHAAPGHAAGGAPAWWAHGVGELLERPAMAGAHLLSAAAVGCWLAVGERALWALISMGSSRVLVLAAALGSALGGVAPILAGTVRRPSVPVGALEPLPQPPLWSRGPVRRGPPSFSLTR